MEKSLQHAQALSDFAQHSIVLIGTSFILGSLFTVFLLVVLDFSRRKQEQKAS